MRKVSFEFIFEEVIGAYWIALRCKRPVNAEKSFSVHKAPVVLTIHLKRFTPLGRKLGHMVAYDERLSLESVMSKGQYGPKYSLYGIISHAGGGPNSGHYYAHVKAANGNWYEMNDESVERVHNAPINMKNAYILFYVQIAGQALEATIKSNGMDASAPRTNGAHIHAPSNGVPKKRKASTSDDEREDAGEKASKPFIGPMLPSSVQTLEKTSKPASNGYTPSASSSSVDPNAEALKKKIEAHTQKTVQQPARTKSASQTSMALVNYSDEDDDDEDCGEAVNRVATPPREEDKDNTANGSSQMDVDSSSNDPPPSSPPISSPVAASSFYGGTDSASTKKTSGSNVCEKTKSFESFVESSESRPVTPVPKPSTNGSNPFNRMRVGNSIDDSYRNRKPQKNIYTSKLKKRRPLF